jgi:hypothetical protein
MLPRVHTLFALVGALALCGIGPMAAAQEGTPTATSVPIAEQAIFSHTFSQEDLPPGEVQAFFYRLTLSPGESLPFLVGPFCGCPGQSVTPGVGIEAVTEGAYTVRLDAPFAVVRGGDEEEIAPGTDVTLTPGEVGVFPDYAAPADIRNDGSGPASVIGVAVVSNESTATPAPSLPMGLETEELARAVPADWRRLPSGPVTLTLRRLTLPAGAALGPYEASGLETFLVEQGEVGLVFMAPDANEPGRPLVYGAGRSAPFVSLNPGTRRLVTNEGDGPATILALAVVPAAADATPRPA